jgi:hypothetical protein
MLLFRLLPVDQEQLDARAIIAPSGEIENPPLISAAGAASPLAAFASLAAKPLAGSNCVPAKTSAWSCSVNPSTTPSARVTRQARHSVVSPVATWAASASGRRLMASPRSAEWRECARP